MGSTNVESYMKLTYLDNEYMLILVLDEKDKKPSMTFFYKKK